MQRIRSCGSASRVLWTEYSTIKTALFIINLYHKIISHSYFKHLYPWFFDALCQQKTCRLLPEASFTVTTPNVVRESWCVPRRVFSRDLPSSRWTSSHPLSVQCHRAFVRFCSILRYRVSLSRWWTITTRRKCSIASLAKLASSVRWRSVRPARRLLAPFSSRPVPLLCIQSVLLVTQACVRFILSVLS